MVTTLLSTLITDRSNKDKSHINMGESILKIDHVEYASQILKLALDNWSTPVNQLRSQTYKALKEYLNDSKSSLASQYGALSALSCLGPEVLREFVLPYMDKYLTNLDIKMADRNYQTNGHNNGQSRPDKEKVLGLNMMRGCFLIASRKMLQKSNKITPRQYAMLYSHFGDSLLMSSTSSMMSKKLSWPAEQSPRRLKIRPIASSMPRYPNDFDRLLGNDTFMNGQMDYHGSDANYEQIAFPLSRSVQQTFYCSQPNTIVRQPRFWIGVGCEQPLKRKRIRNIHSRVSPDFKAFQGAIGKRMGRRLNQQSKRKRHQRLLSCSIHSVL